MRSLVLLLFSCAASYAQCPQGYTLTGGVCVANGSGGGSSFPGCTSGGAGAITCPNGFGSGTGASRITVTGGAAPAAPPATGQEIVYLDSADNGLKTINSASAISVLATTAGNVATASALATAPALCSSGQAPTGVLANGNATGCASIGGGGGGSFNPLDITTAWWREEMYANDGHWTFGGTVTPYVNNQNNPGVFEITAAAGSGQAAYIILSWSGGQNFAYYPAGAWSQVWVAQAVSTTLVQYDLGWGNAYGSKQIAIEFNPTRSASDWYGLVNNGGTIVAVDTGVAISATGYTNFAIASNGSQLSFSVNGSSPVTICPSGCTATGSIPFGGADATSPDILIQNQDASNTKTMIADFFAMTMAVTR